MKCTVPDTCLTLDASPPFLAQNNVFIHIPGTESPGFYCFFICLHPAKNKKNRAVMWYAPTITITGHTASPFLMWCDTGVTWMVEKIVDCLSSLPPKFVRYKICENHWQYIFSLLKCKKKLPGSISEQARQVFALGYTSVTYNVSHDSHHSCDYPPKEGCLYF